MTETTTTNDKPLVSPAVIARRYQLKTEKTVRRWAGRGCPAHRAGRKLLFVVDEVDAWTLEQGKPVPTNDTTEVTNAAHE